MTSIGRVTGREIKTNMDGQTAKLLLQVELTDPEDIQTIELVRQAGEDTNPPDDSRVIVLDVGSFKVAVASDDGIVPTMGEGEKKIYSTAAGLRKAFINFLSTDIVEINGTGDFAVRFNELKDGFDQLVSDFNAHVHTETGGTTSVPTSSSSANIDSSKVDLVKLKGVGIPR